MQTHPSRNNNKANLFSGLTALSMALMTFAVFYIARRVYGQAESFNYFLSHPLILAMAGICSKFGADIGLYLFKLRYKYVSMQHKADNRLIAFWIFSVFIFMSILRLLGGGMNLNPL